MPFRDLDVLDAAEQVVDQVNALISRTKQPPMLYVGQLRDAVGSIAANIAEGFGRGPGRARTGSLKIARGETEEAIRHLGANFRDNRIGPKDYFPLHNRLVVIAKMLNALIYS